MELTPEKIHKQYQKKILNKFSASKLLFSLIETSESEKIRVESMQKLGKLELNDNETYMFLENLFISDSNDIVRNTAANILKSQFGDKIFRLMKWALIHEESPLCLSTIHLTLIDIIENLLNNNDQISKSILLKEVRNIQRKEFKLGFKILCEKTSLEKITKRELAEILINFFTIETLEKTHWRINSKIEKCKIIELDFIFKGLASLPEPIKYLSSLKTLIMRYNQIISLPKWIGSLKSLELLNLNVNNLNYLPESIGSLSSLKELLLWKNELRSLPNAVDKLSNLLTLNVRLNHLEKLPKRIGNLYALKELNAHNNQLIEIPSSIAQLKFLEELNLSWNNLKNLPSSIGGLVSLKILDLEKNELKELPETLGSLTSLEILNLSDNQLEQIPDVFQSLKSLVYLNLSRNELKIIPESIKSLNSLKELYLNDNNFEEFPNWLRNLEIIGVKIYK